LPVAFGNRAGRDRTMQVKSTEAPRFVAIPIG